MKKKVTQKEFEDVVVYKYKDIEFILQQLVSTIRKMNRDGKLEDYRFTFLHKDIELIFRTKK